MKAKLQNWYYGADGKKPLRRMKFHKILLIILIAAIIVAFFVLDYNYNELDVKLITATGIFSGIIIFGFATITIDVHFYELYSQGIYYLVLFAVSLVGGFYIGWFVAPLYLLFAIIDIRYCRKVKKSNPDMFVKNKPAHKNLAKKNDSDT